MPIPRAISIVYKQNTGSSCVIVSMAESGIETIFDTEDKQATERKAEESTTEVNDRKRPRVSADSSVSEAGDFSALNTEILAIKEQMKNVLIAVSRVSTELQSLGTSVSLILKKMDEVDERFKEVNKRLDKQGGDVTQTKKALESMEKKVSSVDVRLKELEWKAVEQEARSRRNNLLFFNVPETENEDCTNVVTKIIKEKLGLSQRSFPIQRAHRLGPVRSRGHIGQGRSRPRPIIVNFLDFRDREAVRSARYKLTAPLNIAEDFPTPIRRARESLLPELKELKNKGKKATIAYPAKLISDGKVVREANVLHFLR